MPNPKQCVLVSPDNGRTRKWLPIPDPLQLKRDAFIFIETNNGKTQMVKVFQKILDAHGVRNGLFLRSRDPRLPLLLSHDTHEATQRIIEYLSIEI